MYESNNKDFRIIKYHLNELSPKEREEVEMWAGQNEKRKKKLNFYQLIVNALNQFKQHQKFDLKRAWLQLTGKIQY